MHSSIAIRGDSEWHELLALAQAAVCLSKLRVDGNALALHDDERIFHIDLDVEMERHLLGTAGLTVGVSTMP